MTDQSFPSPVHSVFGGPTSAWPLHPQGKNECSFYALAHALNLQKGASAYHPDTFRHNVGVLFQRGMGGTLPPLKAWQLRNLGYGSHYGNLSQTDSESVLKSLIDIRIPVIVDIYSAAQWHTTRIYGRHAVVLVGYSDAYIDASGATRQEFYLLDSEWPTFGRCTATDNNRDRDGDGIVEDYPGNRTLSRAEFLTLHTTRTYTPIFPDVLSHARWYNDLFGWHNPSIYECWVSGTVDRVKSPEKRYRRVDSSYSTMWSKR
jgi:hypothetical protein